MPENRSRTTGILQKQKPESTSLANDPLAEKTSVAPESSFVSPAKEHAIVVAAITTKEKGQEFFKISKSREKSQAKPLFLKKKPAPVISSDGDTGTFLLYILAFILAIAIIVLAFYFVPAVIIPAIATEKVLEILAIIICTLVFAICAAIHTLITNFIDFIRRKKTGSGKFYS